MCRLMPQNTQIARISDGTQRTGARAAAATESYSRMYSRRAAPHIDGFDRAPIGSAEGACRIELVYARDTSKAVSLSRES